MSRYNYDASLVSQGIDLLRQANNKLNDVNSGISNGISTIQSATGGQFITIDASPILTLRDSCQSGINEIISLINDKVNQIEEYSNASWMTKTFSTIGMGGTKLIEGIGTACETIVDGCATLAGAVAGIFSNDVKNSIGNFIKTDYVGDAFAKSYESGLLSSIEKYSIMSSKSTAANVFKGVGVAAAYVGLAALTGGVAGALGIGGGAAAGASSIALNATIAGVGGLGSGTQSGLQNDKSFYSAALQGATQGAIQAGTVVAAGVLTNKISSALAAKETSSTALAVVPESEVALTSSADDVLAVAEKSVVSSTDDAIAALPEAGSSATSSTIDDVISTTSTTASTSDEIFDKIIATKVGKDGRTYAVIKKADGTFDSWFPDYGPIGGNSGKAVNIDSATMKNFISENNIDIGSAAASEYAKNGINFTSTASKATATSAESAVTETAETVSAAKILNADGETVAYTANSTASFGDKVVTALKNRALDAKKIVGQPTTISAFAADASTQIMNNALNTSANNNVQQTNVEIPSSSNRVFFDNSATINDVPINTINNEATDTSSSISNTISSNINSSSNYNKNADNIFINSNLSTNNIDSNENTLLKEDIIDNSELSTFGSQSSTSEIFTPISENEQDIVLNSNFEENNERIIYDSTSKIKSSKIPTKASEELKSEVNTKVSNNAESSSQIQNSGISTTESSTTNYVEEQTLNSNDIQGKTTVDTGNQILVGDSTKISSSVDDVVKKQSQINKPAVTIDNLTTQDVSSTNNDNSNVLKTVLGVGATATAAAVGLGIKSHLDNKKNNENEYDQKKKSKFIKWKASDE